MKTRAFALVAVVFLTPMQAGCGLLSSAAPVLNDVLVYAQDASTILDIVDSITKKYFASHPDAAKEEEVSQKMLACRAAVNVAVRATQGAKAADQGKTEEAYAQFRAAYKELTALLTALHLAPPVDSPKKGVVAATYGATLIEIPEPLAMKVHEVKK
jgi:hypothetical protein